MTGLLILFFLFIVGLIMYAGRDNCVHDWDCIDKNKRELLDGYDNQVGYVYHYEYKCKKCGIHKTDMQKRRI